MIFNHALQGISSGGNEVITTACSDVVSQWKQAADQSALYNWLPGRKIEGKSIGNRLQFTEFLTTKVFSNFADHMSPKWQNIFKEQLKDLSFDDAYAVYLKLCDISKEYITSEDEKIACERELQEIHDKKKGSQGSPKQLRHRELEIKTSLRNIAEKQNTLNEKLNDVASDCVRRTSIAHTKKMLSLKPAKQQKAQQKLEKATGFFTAEMRALTNLQVELNRKMDELSNIDKILKPADYAAKKKNVII